MSTRHAVLLRRRRGQGGFALTAALTVWVGISGVTMIALLGMTLSSGRIATRQADGSATRRAVDAALEVAVNEIATDPSGRRGTPHRDGGGRCDEDLGQGRDASLSQRSPDGVVVEVTARCLAGPGGGPVHRVQLTAVVVRGVDGGTPTGGGSALLEVNEDRSDLGVNGVAVLRWRIDRAEDPVPVPATTTTAPPTTTTTTTAPPTTTTTTTTTTVPPTTVPPIEPAQNATWSSRVTSDWGAGYCVQVTVANPGVTPLEWVVHVPVEGTVYTDWSGVFRRVGDTLVVSGQDWNRRLTNRQTTTFGFCANR